MFCYVFWKTVDMEFTNNFLKGGKYKKIKDCLLFFIFIKKVNLKAIIYEFRLHIILAFRLHLCYNF